MKLNIFFLFLCSSAGVASEIKNCECFITYFHRQVGETNMNFTKNVDVKISSFVVGFTFAHKVSSITPFGSRQSIKVNDTLWFVTETYNLPTDFVNFDMLVKHTHKNEVEKIVFNGETICPKTFSDHGDSNKNSVDKGIIAFPIINCILIIALLGLLTVLVFKISKLMTLTDKHWQEAINQVVDIQRRLSPNNPNNKGVPLPEVPDSKIPPPDRGTYIDLQSYQCTNFKCSKKYNRLLRAVNQLPDSVKKDFRFCEGSSAQANEYVVHEKPRKQGTL